MPPRYFLKVLTLAQLLKLSFTYFLKTLVVCNILPGIMVILSIMIGNKFFYQDYVEMRKKY